MKLLFCYHCQDVFKLNVGVLRQCACGKVKGMYKDNTYAVVNGEGLSLAVGNGSLLEAARHLGGVGEDRKFYPVMCWVRPHESVHVTVNPNL